MNDNFVSHLECSHSDKNYPAGKIFGLSECTCSINSLRIVTASCLIVLLMTLSIFAQEKKETETKSIKVMSYNIHYGQGMDKKIDLARIAKIISDQDPDIVGLQEIGNQAMAEKIGELADMRVVFGASKGSAEQYGDAVLCKHPFEWVNNFSIPSASSSRYQAMAIDVDLSEIFGKGKKVRFINTHFDWLDTLGSKEARLASVEVIEKGFIEGSQLPAILTGDLNAVPDSAPMAKLSEKGWVNENLGKELRTIGSKDRGKQIDYVLFRTKEKWKAVDVSVLDEPVASDHLPIVMTLQIEN